MDVFESSIKSFKKILVYLTILVNINLVWKKIIFWHTNIPSHSTLPTSSNRTGHLLQLFYIHLCKSEVKYTHHKKLNNYSLIKVNKWMVQDNTRENKFKIQKTRQWSIMQQWKEKKFAKGEWREKIETKISRFYKKGTKVQRKINV